MGFTDQLAILVSLDTQAAAREVQKFGTDAERDLNKVTSGSDRLGSQFVKTGALMVGAAGVIGAGLLSAGNAAASEAQEIATLDQALQNNLDMTSRQREGVEKQITAWQNATGFADGQLRPALAKLVIAGQSWTEAQDSMNVAMDISRARGVDLESVTTAMAKAAGGNVTALQKMGVATKDASGEALSFDEILQTASRTMGGSAAAAADTAAGRAQILKAKLADLKEEIGTAVIPVLEKVTSVTGDVAGGITSVNDATGGFVGKGALIAAGGLAISGGLLVGAGAVLKLKNNLTELATTAPRTASAISSIATIGTGVGALFAVAGGIAAVTGKAYDLDGALDHLSRTADRSLIPTFAKIGANAMVEGASGLEVFQKAAESNIGTATRLAAQLKDHPALLQQMGLKASDLDRVLRQEASAQRQVNSDTEAGTGIIDENADATKAATATILDRRDALAGQFNADLAYQQSLLGVTQAETDAATATKEHGENSIEAQQAAIGVKEAYIRVAEAARQKAQDEATAMGRTDAAAQGSAAYRLELGRLASTMEPGSPMRVYLEGLATKLDELATPHVIPVDMDTSRADAKMADLVRRLEGIFQQDYTIGIGVRAPDSFLNGRTTGP